MFTSARVSADPIITNHTSRVSASISARVSAGPIITNHTSRVSASVSARVSAGPIDPHQFHSLLISNGE